MLASLLLAAVEPRQVARIIRDEGADAERIADGVVALAHGLLTTSRPCGPAAAAAVTPGTDHEPRTAA